jgi:hypothetical protein
MIPVNSLIEAGAHFGAIGYSVIYRGFGDTRRVTLVMLRDNNGTPISSIFAPAEVLRLRITRSSSIRYDFPPKMSQHFTYL